MELPPTPEIDQDDYVWATLVGLESLFAKNDSIRFSISQLSSVNQSFSSKNRILFSLKKLCQDERVECLTGEDYFEFSDEIDHDEKLFMLTEVGLTFLETRLAAQKNLDSALVDRKWLESRNYREEAGWLKLLAIVYVTGSKSLFGICSVTILEADERFSHACERLIQEEMLTRSLFGTQLSLTEKGWGYLDSMMKGRGIKIATLPEKLEALQKRIRNV